MLEGANDETTPLSENAMAAIQTAIQMEKDGYAFYQKAAAQTRSDMGREIFDGLAQDELDHLKVFQRIFDAQVDGSDWDKLVVSSKKYANLPIFPKDLGGVKGAGPDTGELEALNIAIDSEKNAIDFYLDILKDTKDEQVRKILEEIISQEKNHYLILSEELHHLTETGFWYEMNIML